MDSPIWVAITKIWFFLLWFLLLILESLGKLLKLMGGQRSTESSSRSASDSPPDHRQRHSQEQYWSSGYPPEWQSHQDYPGPYRSYDSASPAYPEPQHNAPSEGYTPSDPQRQSLRYRQSSPPRSSMSRAPPMQSSSPRAPPMRPSVSRAPPVQSSSSRAPPMQSSSSRAPPMQSSASQASSSRRRLERKYSKIADNFRSLEEVTDALAKAGLESSNLIVGIDFTKSNEWTGKHSFNGRSLHYIGDEQNPYEQAITIIGQTLSTFDEDNLIPCFGFGDASTHDQDVFSFYPDESPCNGFIEALGRYREIVQHLRLAGPTSFAPIIEMAMTIVEQSDGQYHVLLIIADGQVTRSVDTDFGQLSPQECKTVDAIVRASEFPLSIVLVGVGDGPWDMMHKFDDNIPARAFDNFQFVNFTEIMSKNVSQAHKETEFALAALMEVPSQYKATLELGILGHQTGKSPERVPLPPLVASFNSAFVSKVSESVGYQQREPSYSSVRATPSTTSTVATASTTSPATASDSQACPVCLSNPRNMAFSCGHQTCCDCGPNLENCPICRREIDVRIKLY